jgi:hypothetical protein
MPGNFGSTGERRAQDRKMGGFCARDACNGHNCGQEIRESSIPGGWFNNDEWRVERQEGGGIMSAWLPGRKKSSKTGLRHRACNASMSSSTVTCRCDDSGSLGTHESMCLCGEPDESYHLIGKAARSRGSEQGCSDRDDDLSASSRQWDLPSSSASRPGRLMEARLCRRAGEPRTMVTNSDLVDNLRQRVGGLGSCGS